jgi:hypothetical protein
MICFQCGKEIKKGAVYYSSSAYGNEFCSIECHAIFMDDDIEININDEE